MTMLVGRDQKTRRAKAWSSIEWRVDASVFPVGAFDMRDGETRMDEHI
jgi:hypothetical protein